MTLELWTLRPGLDGIYKYHTHIPFSPPFHVYSNPTHLPTHAITRLSRAHSLISKTPHPASSYIMVQLAGKEVGRIGFGLMGKSSRIP